MERLQRGGGPPWTLTLVGKTSWKKVCGAQFFSKFSKMKEVKKKKKDGGWMVSTLAPCCPGKTARSHAIGTLGTWGND